MPSGHRILIVSASIGGGHVAAGRALEQAFASRGIACQHVDLLDYTSAPFRTVYRDAYLEGVRAAPDVVEFVGKRLDRKPGERPSRGRRLRARLSRLISYQLPRVIDRVRPDLVVHTHFMPPDILASTRRLSDVRQVTVITDFGAHALWMSPGIERYFVASEAIAAHLRASGVDEERVEVTGIPIGPSFASLPARDAARSMLGVDGDRDAMLLMASGMPRSTLRPVLKGLLEIKWPLDVWVVCGRSPDLLDVASQAAAENTDLVRLVPLGFVHDVPLRMAASTLVAGKPGGLTVAESLAAGVPFAVIDPYPLQEEANALHLLEAGAGVRIEPITTLALKLGSVLADPERRERMATSARQAGRPHAAAAVVEACERLLERAP